MYGTLEELASGSVTCTLEERVGRAVDLFWWFRREEERWGTPEGGESTPQPLEGLTLIFHRSVGVDPFWVSLVYPNSQCITAFLCSAFVCFIFPVAYPSHV